MKFGKTNCQFRKEGNLIAVATKVGELYYLNMSEYASLAESQVQGFKEGKWH